MNSGRQHRAPAARSATAQAGVTLVETMVVSSVLAVLTTLAAPGFQGIAERQQLQGAAAVLETDIHHARMLAVARNAPLRISFESNAAGTCYVVHTGAASACGCNSNGTAACQGGAVAERVVHFPAGGALSVASNSRSVLFDAGRGTATPTATMQLTGQGGAAIRQVMNIMGRVRSCSPSAKLAGFKPC